LCKDVRLQDKEILVFVKLIRVTLPEKWPFVGVQIVSLLWKQFLGAVKNSYERWFQNLYYTIDCKGLIFISISAINAHGSPSSVTPRVVNKAVLLGK